MTNIITDEQLFMLRDAAKHGDVEKFDRVIEQREDASATEWACIAIVAAVLVAGLFAAGYAVGKTVGMREARSAAVVDAAKRDGLAMLTGAVALAANNGDAIKAARFVREATKGGAR